MVIKINSSPTPPLRPQTQFLSFSKFITSYTYSLLLLRRSLKSSHPILVHEYSIILLILPFQNLIIIIRCIELKFEHLSAHPLFFIPFLLIHINTGTYSHDSCVCMRVEWFYLVWTYIVLINKMIHIIALFCRFLSFWYFMECSFIILLCSWMFKFLDLNSCFCNLSG